MKEQDYIIVTNRVKISSAISLLGDVSVGQDYKIDQDDFRKILKTLREIETRLFYETSLLVHE